MRSACPATHRGHEVTRRSRGRRRRSRRRSRRRGARPGRFAFAKKRSRSEKAGPADGDRSPGSCRTCPLRITLAPSLVRELRGFVENGGASPGGKHREVGGTIPLRWNGNGHEGDEILHRTEGDGDGTKVPPDFFGCITFHTHPAGQYEEEKVNAAWPSGMDLDSIVKKMVSRTENAAAHVVASKEGMWVVTLAPEAIRRGRTAVREHGPDAAAAHYQRDLPGRSPGRSPESDVKEYLDSLKGVPREKRLFRIQLVPWPARGSMQFSGPTLTAERPSCDGGSCGSLASCAVSDF